MTHIAIATARHIAQPASSMRLSAATLALAAMTFVPRGKPVFSEAISALISLLAKLGGLSSSIISKSG